MIFELGPQTVYVNIQGIFLHLGCRTPTRFDQLFACGDQTFTPNESFKKLKLLPRQSDLLTLRLTDFKTNPNSTMVDMGFQLSMWIGAVAHPEVGYGASIGGLRTMSSLR